MKTRIGVLLLGAGRRQSVAREIIESGRRLGLDLDLYAFENSRHVPVAEYSQVITGGAFDDPSTYDELLGIVAAREIQIAIPFHDKAIPLAGQLSQRIFAPVSRNDVSEIFFSKIRTARFLRSHSLPCPEIATSVPAIAKPDFGSASRGLEVFQRQEDLENFLASPRASGYEIQVYCGGEEISIDSYVCKSTQNVYISPRIREETVGGEVIRSRTIQDSNIEDVALELLRAADFSGAVTIQMIKDHRDGKYKIMEVNPRFGGGVMTTVLAGLPLFEIMLRDYLRIGQGSYNLNQNFLMVRSFHEFGFTLESSNEDK